MGAALTIVNYPVRRRIVSLLMIIGNMGLVTVFATVVVSLVNTDGEAGAVARQVAWLTGGLLLLWFLMLNARADHVLCAFISKVLRSTTFLGQRRYERLVQIADGYSVCEHPLRSEWLTGECALEASGLADLGLQILAVRSPLGSISYDRFKSTRRLQSGDALVLYGRDTGHDVLEQRLKLNR